MPKRGARPQASSTSVKPETKAAVSQPASASSSGVTLYTIGFKLSKARRGGRSRLARLARETGGRAFFVGSTDELVEIYELVQRDLRSRYLLVYQPALDGENDGFRRIEVRVGRVGAEVRARSGYFP